METTGFKHASASATEAPHALRAAKNDTIETHKVYKNPFRGGRRKLQTARAYNDPVNKA